MALYQEARHTSSKSLMVFHTQHLYAAAEVKACLTEIPIRPFADEVQSCRALRQQVQQNAAGLCAGLQHHLECCMLMNHSAIDQGKHPASLPLLCPCTRGSAVAGLCTCHCLYVAAARQNFHGLS